MSVDINYQVEAETLADTLFAVIDLSIGTELENADAINLGWEVWTAYYNRTHVPRSMGQLMADVTRAKRQLLRGGDQEN